jgi:putative oxidoreductase
MAWWYSLDSVEISPLNKPGRRHFLLTTRCGNLHIFISEARLRYLDRLQPLALLVMRLVLGVVMVAHGYQKVFGGLHHHVQFVESLGLPGWSAYLSAFAEFFGGLLVLVGLFTRAAAFFICFDLCVAIAKVHLHHGLMASKGGFELPLALAALAFGLIFYGGGAIAFDHVRAPSGAAKSR